MDKNINTINKKTMRESVNHYTWSYDLTKSEVAALEYIGDFNDKSILDIGVGAGRTVNTLKNNSKSYIGLDYVDEMVEKCQKIFPDVHFEQGDACNLSKFNDKSFDVIMFSMNGISMVDHQGRMKILNEIYRLLAPGGTFLFSTYNQNNKEYSKLLQLPKFDFTFNPVKFGVRCVRYSHQLVKRAYNRYQFKKLEYKTDEYSIINDKCHNYATMLYYITQENQRKQLTSVGFGSNILSFDLDGQKSKSDTPDDSLFFVVKKPENSSHSIQINRKTIN